MSSFDLTRERKKRTRQIKADVSQTYKFGSRKCKVFPSDGFP